jgi:hypothetical protein
MTTVEWRLDGLMKQILQNMQDGTTEVVAAGQPAPIPAEEIFEVAEQLREQSDR